MASHPHYKLLPRCFHQTGFYPLSDVPTGLQFFHRLKRRRKRRDQILRLLDPDGKPDGVGPDALIQQLLGGKLGVGGGGRVDDKGFYIRHVGQKRENFQAVNKFVGFRLTAIDLKGEDGRATVGEILLI